MGTVALRNTVPAEVCDNMTLLCIKTNNHKASHLSILHMSKDHIELMTVVYVPVLEIPS